MHARRRYADAELAQLSGQPAAQRRKFRDRRGDVHVNPRGQLDNRGMRLRTHMRGQLVG